MDFIPAVWRRENNLYFRRKLPDFSYLVELKLILNFYLDVVTEYFLHGRTHGQASYVEISKADAEDTVISR